MVSASFAPNKQLQRTVQTVSRRAASASFHYELAPRWTAQQRPLNCGVMRRESSGVAAMSRRSGVAIAIALLVACDSGPDNTTSIDEAESAPTQAEQIADAMRESRLIGEEMRTVAGPSVLVTVERGGEPLFATSPGAVTTGGYFSIDARFNDGKSVMVYVPEDVVVPNGALIYVVAGQHGHYFRSFASDAQP